MNDPNDTTVDKTSLLTKRLPIVWLSKIFVVLVCLSLLTIDAFQTWRAYQVRLNDSNVLAANLVRSLAQQAEDTIKEADTILVGMVERVDVDGISAANLKRLHGMLIKQVAELPKLHGLFIYDEHGRWLVNSQPTLFSNANNADREYFIHHRDHPERTPHIGKPVRSRSTGEWILTVSRRVNHADGSFAGVVLATVQISYFSKFYDTFNIGNDGTIFLAHSDGSLLVRRPFLEDWVGKSLKDSPLFQQYLPKAPSGTYTSNQSVIDSFDRLISYRRVEHYPLVVGMSMSKEEIFRSWWEDAAKHFLVTLLLTLFLGFLGVLLTRQIGQRLRAERDLQQAQDELEALNQELKMMAMQDGLTGLANRRRFDIALNDEFNRAMRKNVSLALVMIDVDSFKQYNDAFGHPAGDECLRKISIAVKTCQKRPGDLTARYGGEEIAVLLPGTDLEGAVAVAEKIRQAVRNLNIVHPNSPAGIITVSCGVDAILPTRNQNLPMDLLKGADQALYLAKSSGRDHVFSALTPAP